MHLCLLFLYLFCYTVQLSTALDTITGTKFLKDPEGIISSNGVFRLSFFSPDNSSNRYVGIWYNQVHPTEVFWVANRDTPLLDTDGQLRISKDGNLILLSKQNKVIWSSNVSHINSLPAAQLLDSGNLVLLGINNSFLWQSFDNPTDTSMPDMKLKVSILTMKQIEKSWSSPSDPSPGKFSVGTDSLTLPQLVIWDWDHDRPYWRSGPWSGNVFIGIEYSRDYTNTGWSLNNDGQGTVSMEYTYPNKSLLSNYKLTYQGSIVQKWWDYVNKEWKVLWRAPETECSVYGKCGGFGIGSCIKEKTPICQCLKGFIPKNKEEWSKGIYNGGCLRRKPLKCGGGKESYDGFLKLEMVKVPDYAEWALGFNGDECRERCFKNCSCLAYSYYSGIGCMSWSRNLVDMVELSHAGADVYLRLAESELGHDKKVNIIIAAVAVAVVATIVVSACIFWRWKNQRRGKRPETNKRLKDKFGGTQNLEKLEELPLFELEKLATATNNFQDSNKLGQGGFGAVYRGTLEDGQEIAVKRLSWVSRQGVEEFMNEVLVISKLQHRNLVRLLGCCVDGEEKMLIYEYMPNKSLDTILFDPLKQGILDWKKRFDIIEGISRGFLYLHRDSRLKIIHRDLKAGNILLDENLNPKISDFGMARIFGGTQNQADTTRVVGTYGYMSPEYAIGGRFSEKSDVYSFGVLMLEIISGKKNRWYDELSLSLLEYAWKMWNEGNVTPFLDPVIADEHYEAEISKCIQVGLLCVQQIAQDRPNMSAVISMLGGEAATLERPTHPGFIQRIMPANDNGRSSSQSHHSGSLNNVSITNVSGR